MIELGLTGKMLHICVRSELIDIIVYVFKSCSTRTQLSPSLFLDGFYNVCNFYARQPFSNLFSIVN